MCQHDLDELQATAETSERGSYLDANNIVNKTGSSALGALYCYVICSLLVPKVLRGDMSGTHAPVSANQRFGKLRVSGNHNDINQGVIIDLSTNSKYWVGM